MLLYSGKEKRYAGKVTGKNNYIFNQRCKKVNH